MVLGKINYFFNPKVVKIESDDFTAERFEYDSENLNLTVTARGLKVYYMG
jgi:hypothetical protein